MSAPFDLARLSDLDAVDLIEVFEEELLKRRGYALTSHGCYADGSGDGVPRGRITSLRLATEDVRRAAGDAV